jgi:tetratricopeptide (TPR) repeat protein
MATSLNNLAMIYHAKGQYEQAEPFYRRALGIFEKSLGSGHPNVKLSLDNLAKLYRATDRPSAAEEVGQRMARLQAQ